jgi:hypothetical protein
LIAGSIAESPKVVIFGLVKLSQFEEDVCCCHVDVRVIGLQSLGRRTEMQRFLVPSELKESDSCKVVGIYIFEDRPRFIVRKLKADTPLTICTAPSNCGSLTGSGRPMSCMSSARGSVSSSR